MANKQNVSGISKRGKKIARALGKPPACHFAVQLSKAPWYPVVIMVIILVARQENAISGAYTPPSCHDAAPLKRSWKRQEIQKEKKNKTSRTRGVKEANS